MFSTLVRHPLTNSIILESPFIEINPQCNFGIILSNCIDFFVLTILSFDIWSTTILYLCFMHRLLYNLPLIRSTILLTSTYFNQFVGRHNRFFSSHVGHRLHHYHLHFTLTLPCRPSSLHPRHPYYFWCYNFRGGLLFRVFLIPCHHIATWTSSYVVHLIDYPYNFHDNIINKHPPKLFSTSINCPFHNLHTFLLWTSN